MQVLRSYHFFRNPIRILLRPLSRLQTAGITKRSRHRPILLFILMLGAFLTGSVTAWLAAQPLLLMLIHDPFRLIWTLSSACVGTASIACVTVARAKWVGRLSSYIYIHHFELYSLIGLIAMLVVGFVITVELLTGPLNVNVPFFLAVYLASAFALGTLLTLAANERHTVLAVWLATLNSSAFLLGQGIFLQNPWIIGFGAVGTALALKSRRSMVLPTNKEGSVGADAPLYLVQPDYKTVRLTDAVRHMKHAQRVILIPGYGLATACAEDQLCELTWLLLARGIDVKVALHPLAGRTPNHLENLLHKAGLTKNIMLHPSEANARFSTTDVALVIGANDIINRAASYTRKLPIFGLPILNIARATKVYVAKRGDGRGYSGLDNDVFLKQNCELLYGDAQVTLDAILARLRAVGSERPESYTPEVESTMPC